MWTVANVRTDLDIFHGPKNDSKFLDANFKNFHKYDHKEFRLVQNLAKEEADFSQFLQLRNQRPAKNEDENFQQTVYVKFRFEEFIYLFDLNLLLIKPFVMSYRK